MANIEKGFGGDGHKEGFKGFWVSFSRESESGVDGIAKGIPEKVESDHGKDDGYAWGKEPPEVEHKDFNVLGLAEHESP